MTGEQTASPKKVAAVIRRFSAHGISIDLMEWKDHVAETGSEVSAVLKESAAIERGRLE